MCGLSLQLTATSRPWSPTDDSGKISGTGWPFFRSIYRLCESGFPTFQALAAYFTLRAVKRLGLPTLTPTVEDIGLLVDYSWPGNVRELAAVIERAAILGDGKRLEIARALGSPVRLSPPNPSRLLPRREEAVAIESTFPTLDQAMARHIEHALARTKGRIEGPDGAAAHLAINPHTLRSRMRKLGIDWRSYRGQGSN